jgi:hypothetical protein
LVPAKRDSVTHPAELSPESLVWAIASLFIIGLGALIGLMAVLKEVLHAPNGLIYAVLLVVFLLMVAIEGVFIRLLLNRPRSAKEREDNERLTQEASKELGPVPVGASIEPIPSVTDHTTRTLEPVHRERKSE